MSNVENDVEKDEAKPEKAKKSISIYLCIVIKLYKVLEPGEFCVSRRVSHDFAQACLHLLFLGLNC